MGKSRSEGEKDHENTGHQKLEAGIIFMGRIKYLEAIGQKLKRGRPPAGSLYVKAKWTR